MREGVQASRRGVGVSVPWNSHHATAHRVKKTESALDSTFSLYDGGDLFLFFGD